MLQKPLSKGSGLTAWALLVIILIGANVFLVSNGHAALDTKLNLIEAQNVRNCEVTAK